MLDKGVSHRIRRGDVQLGAADYDCVALLDAVEKSALQTGGVPHLIERPRMLEVLDGPMDQLVAQSTGRALMRLRPNVAGPQFFLPGSVHLAITRLNSSTIVDAIGPVAAT